MHFKQSKSSKLINTKQLKNTWHILKTKQSLTFFKTSCNPGDKVIQATTVPTNNIIAYISREDVEFLHDGHAEQHREHAALPQQQANCKQLKILDIKNKRESWCLFSIPVLQNKGPKRLPFWRFNTRIQCKILIILRFATGGMSNTLQTPKTITRLLIIGAIKKVQCYLRPDKLSNDRLTGDKTENKNKTHTGYQNNITEETDILVW